MIYLRTGLPGASKSLNSLRELVLSHDPDRPYFYTNIKLLMLDMEVARSFSGWFYGWYFRNLKDKAQKRKLIKIMKPIHDNDDFITLDDVPFLKNAFESHRHFDTWHYWVKRVYPKSSLDKLSNILDCMTEEQLNSNEVWESVKVCNLHFTRFDDPNYWFDLPKKSVILIDECQQFFPPRPVGSRKPEAIAKLETHRHGGYDLHFITQHATLADQNLRKLVGRHVHFHNPFGGKRIARYEAPKCVDFDNYHDKKQATKKFTVHDTNFYGVYWSAEIHTHKFKFPKMLFVALFTVLLVIACFFFVVNLITGKMDKNPQPASKLVDSSSAVSTDSVSTDSVSSVQTNSSSSVPASDFFEQYLSSVVVDVYISGSMIVKSDMGKTIDYVFYRSSDDSVFHPEDVGFSVDPVNTCLAYIKVGDAIRPVTCNPFYVRQVVDDESDFLLDENSSDDNFSI